MPIFSILLLAFVIVIAISLIKGLMKVAKVFIFLFCIYLIISIPFVHQIIMQLIG